jgi:uncharacterized RDD family membrane protein YckC
MSAPVHFETPENVRIAYQAAGLGTRFTAWLLDTLFVTLVSILLAVLILMAFMALGVAAVDLDRAFQNADRSNPEQFVFYAMGAIVLTFQFGSLVYFAGCELFWRGRTIGKRYMGIHVVKSDGFSLDAGSVLLRNVFRLIDQIPVLWVVPLLSARSQRFGDMAAGTVVVSMAPIQLSDLRTRLMDRSTAEARFRFDGGMLARATPVDVEAAERILERFGQLSEATRGELLARVVDPLAARLKASSPDVADRRQFLEEFLAAIYRRDARRLD